MPGIHSGRYPLVELATGILFFFFVLWLGPTLEALKMCVYAAIQIALIAMDFEERILADEFTLGGILAGLLFAAFVPMPPGLVQLMLPKVGLAPQSRWLSRRPVPDF